MDIKPLSESVSVAGQLSVEDVGEVAKAGFRSIICNRPDGEGPDQTPFAMIAEAAKVPGLEVKYIPVTPPHVSPEQIAEFKAAIEEMPGPVLAYCRSGARSASLWTLATQS